MEVKPLSMIIHGRSMTLHPDNTGDMTILIGKILENECYAKVKGYDNRIDDGHLIKSVEAFTGFPVDDDWEAALGSLYVEVEHLINGGSELFTVIRI